jgi:short-subunit dehydrogenase
MTIETNNGATSKGSALITGASAGIGAIYADRLARRGYDLILVARDQGKLDNVAKPLLASGHKVETIAADLTVKSDLQRIEQRLQSDRSITALINNAGIGATSSMLDADVQQLETMILLNVLALTRLTHAVLPSFVARDNGLIINIASIVALDPLILNGSYSGTKAFVLNLSQSLQNELKATGVRIQAVLPGATSTEFWDRAGLPIAHLPAEIVMSTEEMVDAALSGLDQQETVTIPALPNIEDWLSYDAARLALTPNLSRSQAAARYR